MLHYDLMLPVSIVCCLFLKKTFGRPLTVWISKSSQVSRRQGYKGNVASMRTSFPLDVCTLPGFCATLADMLSARGLGKTLLDGILHCFTHLNKLAGVSTTLKLLPNDCWITVEDGCMSKDDVKKALDCLQIDFQRSGVFKNMHATNENLLY